MGPNFEKGEVAFGPSHILKLGTNALVAAERKLGVKIPVMLANMNGGAFGFEEVCILAWAGLQKHHPDLDESEVGDLIDEIGFQDATQMVAAGIQAGLPVSAEGKAKKPKPK